MRALVLVSRKKHVSLALQAKHLRSQGLPQLEHHPRAAAARGACGSLTPAQAAVTATKQLHKVTEPAANSPLKGPGPEAQEIFGPLRTKKRCFQKGSSLLMPQVWFQHKQTHHKLIACNTTTLLGNSSRGVRATGTSLAAFGNHQTVVRAVGDGKCQ